jgi:hypothetical protein
MSDECDGFALSLGHIMKLFLVYRDCQESMRIMNTGRRGIYIWLMMLGVAVALVVLAGALGTAALSAEVAIAIMAAYVAMALVAVAGNRLQHLQVPRPNLRAAVRTTPAARRATQRARSRPGYNADHAITDIGLIVNQKRRDGRWERHLAQSVSMDEHAIQPYMTVDVPPNLAQRLALIQFDIYDQAGRPQFSRQVEQWVRDGDNSIICDRQLPLARNESLGRSGIWDLRVAIDGALAAIHSFSVTPSTEEQRRQFTDDGEAVGERLEIADDDLPVSLEDLLREQREQGER